MVQRHGTSSVECESMRRQVVFALALVCVAAIFAMKPCIAFGRHPSQPSASGQDKNLLEPLEQEAVTLLVSVRQSTGAPVEVSAMVTLDALAGSLHAYSSTHDAGMASFPNIPTGDYNVQVSASGYQTTAEQIEVIGTGSNYTVYVYIQPESAAGTPSPPGVPTIMTRRLQSEVDKALQKMHSGRYDAARGDLEKTALMAPSNAHILYLLGVLENKQGHQEAAESKFQAAIALSPNEEESRIALGEIYLHTGRADEAVQTLEKAYQQNGGDWRTHLLLAEAYAAKKSYALAEPHAMRAVELAQSYQATAELLLGRILAAEGKAQEAIRALEALLSKRPNDSAAQGAKMELQKLALIPANQKIQPKEPTAEPPENAIVSPAPLLVQAWAPPDIDAKEYPVAADVGCPLDEVLGRAELRAKKQLSNFERFAATERIVHQQVDAKGNPGSPRERDFAYLVFIQPMGDGSYFLQEQRDGGAGLDEFPTRLASTGLISLGVAVFRADFQKDLVYKCEGLGKWRDQPTWQIRFEQRKEVPSRLRTWRNGTEVTRLPLKGRVWLSANTYDVLHLETDLREPQHQIQLTRDHLIVDYGPVHFDRAATSLWLPWYAELFMEVRGKRYHHRHALTNYSLFSVTTNDVISPPREAQPE